jgi:hypothetical protein
MNTMKILKLTLKKKWFDLILSGEKKEEYREKKDYWITRLCDFDKCLQTNSYNHFKHFDAVQFTNGYSATSPTFVIECKGIEIAKGKTHWGAEPHEKYFVIKLGKIIQ